MVTIKQGIKKEEFDKKLAEIQSLKKINAFKYCGIISLNEDALEIQKKMRDEWR